MWWTLTNRLFRWHVRSWLLNHIRLHGYYPLPLTVPSRLPPFRPQLLWTTSWDSLRDRRPPAAAVATKVVAVDAAHAHCTSVMVTVTAAWWSATTPPGRRRRRRCCIRRRYCRRGQRHSSANRTSPSAVAAAAAARLTSVTSSAAVTASSTAATGGGPCWPCSWCWPPPLVIYLSVWQSRGSAASKMSLTIFSCHWQSPTSWLLCSSCLSVYLHSSKVCN